MKKLTVLLICLLLAVPVGAGAEADWAWLEEHLAETYGLEAGEYQVAEVFTMELDGKAVAIATWFTDAPDNHKGQVGWIEAEQRVVPADELAAMLEQHRLEEQQRWEELLKHAGNMDAWLYGQLVEMDPAEKVEIYILPRFELTPQLEEEIRALYREYGMEPPQDLEGWISPDRPISSEPGIRDGDAQSVPPRSADGQSEPGHPGSDGGGGAGEDGYEGQGNTSTPPGYGGDDPGDDAREPEDIDWEGAEPVPMPMPEPVDEEFYTELARLYARGFEAAGKKIEAELRAQGIDFSTDGYGFLATATAKQALGLRNHADIAWIGWPVTLDDTAEILPAFLADARQAAAENAEPAAASGSVPWLLVGGLGAAMAALLWFVIKKY